MEIFNKKKPHLTPDVAFMFGALPCNYYIKLKNYA
jgi:hypothetical protein